MELRPGIAGDEQDPGASGRKPSRLCSPGLCLLGRCCKKPTPTNLRVLPCPYTQLPDAGGQQCDFWMLGGKTTQNLLDNNKKFTGINQEIKCSRHFCHTHLACFLFPVSLFFFFHKVIFSGILLSLMVLQWLFLRTSPFGIFLCVVSLFCEQNMPASETESHLVTKYTDSLNEVVDLLCRWGSPQLLSVGQLWFVLKVQKFSEAPAPSVF